MFRYWYCDGANGVPVGSSAVTSTVVLSPICSRSGTASTSVSTSATCTVATAGALWLRHASVTVTRTVPGRRGTSRAVAAPATCSTVATVASSTAKM